MALKIKPLPKPALQAPIRADLTFEASPYVGDEPWEEGVEYFHAWLCDEFKVGAAFPDYQVSRDLDVHRCISDLWLAAVIQAGFAKEHFFRIGPKSTNNTGYNEAPGFVLLPPKRPLIVNVTVPSELVEFDPWTDRSLDADVPDALYPDQYIDKHYDVLLNEVFIVERQQRRRGRKPVYAVDYGEHPRHADQVKNPVQAAPPVRWRETIDALSLNL